MTKQKTIKEAVEEEIGKEEFLSDGKTGRIVGKTIDLTLDKFAKLLKEEVTKNASKEDGCIHHFNVHEIIDKHTGKKSMEEK
ncbi:MAG TPA: hypothetical protein ENH46_00675 [Candidatus Pacearchaeota archaeon]|nr:hypothetical protein [Candidatus Pacearchaeota archaeon]